MNGRREAPSPNEEAVGDGDKVDIAVKRKWREAKDIMVVERNRLYLLRLRRLCQMEMWMFQGADDGKSQQNAGTKIDAPILGNGDLLAAVAGDGRVSTVLVYDQ